MIAVAAGPIAVGVPTVVLGHHGAASTGTVLPMLCGAMISSKRSRSPGRQAGHAIQLRGVGLDLEEEILDLRIGQRSMAAGERLGPGFGVPLEPLANGAGHVAAAILAGRCLRQFRGPAMAIQPSMAIACWSMEIEKAGSQKKSCGRRTAARRAACGPWSSPASPATAPTGSRCWSS